MGRDRTLRGDIEQQRGAAPWREESGERFGRHRARVHAGGEQRESIPAAQKVACKCRARMDWHLRC